MGAPINILGTFGDQFDNTIIPDPDAIYLDYFIYNDYYDLELEASEENDNITFILPLRDDVTQEEVEAAEGDIESQLALVRDDNPFAALADDE